MIEAIDDPEVYRIYGDYLQTLGDPRGELIALALADHKSAKAFVRQHPELLSFEDLVFELELRWGVIECARLWNGEPHDSAPADDADIPGKLERLLAHPAARFLKRLHLGVIEADNNYTKVNAILAKHPIPSLRELFLGDTANDMIGIGDTDLGDLSNVYAALPNLEILRLRGGKMKLGTIALPKLREIEITTGGLTRESLASIATATMPLLETAMIYFGAEQYGATCTLLDVDALLTSDRFAKLRHLGLVNSELTDELCSNLGRPLIAQLVRLELGHGWLSDKGVDQLVANAATIKHLDVLDLSRSYVTAPAIKRLERALPKTNVIAGGKRRGSVRYTMIGD